MSFHAHTHGAARYDDRSAPRDDAGTMLLCPGLSLAILAAHGARAPASRAIFLDCLTAALPSAALCLTPILPEISRRAALYALADRNISIGCNRHTTGHFLAGAARPRTPLFIMKTSSRSLLESAFQHFRCAAWAPSIVLPFIFSSHDATCDYDEASDDFDYFCCAPLRM